MKKHIIFLDFDGVICTRRSHFAFGTSTMQRALDPTSVAMINRLAVLWNAKIVISSTWRLLYTKERLEEMLKFDVEFHENWHTSMNIMGKRYEEIELWLKENEWDDFIVLDDDVSSGQEIMGRKGRVIQTDMDNGFSSGHYVEALHKIPIKFEKHREKFYMKNNV